MFVGKRSFGSQQSSQLRLIYCFSVFLYIFHCVMSDYDEEVLLNEGQYDGDGDTVMRTAPRDTRSTTKRKASFVPSQEVVDELQQAESAGHVSVDSIVRPRASTSQAVFQQVGSPQPVDIRDIPVPPAPPVQRPVVGGGDRIAGDPATRRLGQYGWLRWRTWASQYSEVNVIPADPLYVALYMLDIYQEARTAAPVNLAFYSISWAHKTAGVEDPTSSVLPKMIREAAPRTLAYFCNKKQPFSVDMLSDIVHKFSCDTRSISDLRLVAMVLVAFAGFLRYKELANLRLSDVVFKPTYMKLFLEQSKTDKYRKGVWVFIAHTYSELCPVKALHRYLFRAGFRSYSEEFIFRGITRNKNVAQRRLKTTNVPLAYTTARSLILKALGELGYDVSQFGTHSLRAGGATAAANRGVEDRLFRKHGRWISEKSKDRYVHEDVAHKLVVSQSLGL